MEQAPILMQSPLMPIAGDERFTTSLKTMGRLAISLDTRANRNGEEVC
jgi:hypothetical protein